MVQGQRIKARSSLLFVFLLLSCTLDRHKKQFILGEQFWQEGKYAEAVAEFEKVARSDANGKYGKQALHRAGMTLTLYLEKHIEAVEKFQTYLSKTGIDPKIEWETRKHIGEIFFNRLKNYRRASEYYEKTISIAPNVEEKAEILYRIGKSKFYLWDFDGAIESYQSLLKTIPSSTYAEKAAYEIGVSYFTHGERQLNAIDAFQKFLKTYPSSELKRYALFSIANCHEELDQLDVARKKYEELLVFPEIEKLVKVKLVRLDERLRLKKR